MMKEAESKIGKQEEEEEEGKQKKLAGNNLLTKTLTEIGKIANFLISITVTSEVELFAIEYGLVQMGTLASEIGGLKLKQAINQIGNNLQIERLFEVLHALVKIRNCLADNFAVLASNHHDVIQGVLIDISVLGRLDNNNNNNNVAFQVSGCAHIITVSQQLDLLLKKSNVNISQHGALMLVYLARVKKYWENDISFDEKTQFAISMLLIATGACARQIQIQLSRFTTNIPKPINKILNNLKELRNMFAHIYATSEKSINRKSRLVKTVPEIKSYQERINQLVIPAINQVGMYKPIDLNSPLTNKPVLLTIPSDSTTSLPESTSMREALAAYYSGDTNYLSTITTTTTTTTIPQTEASTTLAPLPSSPSGSTTSILQALTNTMPVSEVRSKESTDSEALSEESSKGQVSLKHKPEQTYIAIEQQQKFDETSQANEPSHFSSKKHRKDDDDKNMPGLGR